MKTYRTTDFDGIEEMPAACPWCGFAMKFIVVRGWSGYLSCEGYSCHAQSPVGETRAECVATWNRVAANRLNSLPPDVRGAAIRHACRLDGDRSNFVGQDNAAGFLADVQLMARYLCNGTECFPELLKALRYAKWFGSQGTVNSDNEDDGKSVSYFIDAAIRNATAAKTGKAEEVNLCNGTGEYGAVSGHPCPGCSRCDRLHAEQPK